MPGWGRRVRRPAARSSAAPSAQAESATKALSVCLTALDQAPDREDLAGGYEADGEAVGDGSGGLPDEGQDVGEGLT